jgi:mono/diheme cytochrome c family protein
MAEKKAVGHAYNVDFLNVVFAASNLFLFISVVWMVWHDYDREWKNYQRRFTALEMEVTQAAIQQADRTIDRNALQKLEAERAEAEKGLATSQAQIQELRGRVSDVDARLYLATQNYQFAKANYDVDRYAYEVRRRDNPEIAEAGGLEIDETFARVNELNLEVERITAERAQTIAELGKYTGQATALTTKLDELTAERRRLETRLAVISPKLINDYFLNAPLLDFMAPTIKIRQVITPNVVDDVNFTRVPKMDRCMTCHLSIDREGYEKYPQPFTTHPNLAAYVGSASPHPLEQVGCTVCHEGMGQSVSFFDAAHTPNTPEKREAWEEQHHWEEPHLWDYPMLPTGMTEASCAKCHLDEVFTPGANALNTAYGTYERAGCYACHKTRGFEGLRKPGPNLTHIQAKLTPEWVKTWVRDPRAVKPATWMPKVWYNSNTSAPEDARRNETEIDATVAYLFANSTPQPFAVASPPRGDASRGKAVVESVGCLGCHLRPDETRDAGGPRRTFGQPFQNIGNKTTSEWVYDWVRDPKHYSPDTFMPDLRLTDAEVADVAAYLVTIKGGAGEAAKAQVDDAAVDEALLDYLRSVMPLEEAKGTLAKMDPNGRKLELGRRVILRYGCFSCHEIKGFETAQPIGIELSEEGSKLLTQLDFAFVDIHHTKLDWFNQKLRDPRSFDQNRVLQPLEKLRMPDFGVSDRERQLLATAIMSFQRDVQPTAAWQPRSARVDMLSAGRALARRRNCVACHEIEGDGGDFRTLVAEPTLAPPLLTPEGAKVQPDWLYAFLRGPITIRPWLAVRMPTFGLTDPEWNRVIQYFGAISNTTGPFRTHEVVPAAGGENLTANGRQLFELLRCQQCHVLGAIPKDQPTANLAPDLRMATDRLQPDWILDWLRAPAQIQPGTRMPAFWPDYPKSPFPQMNGSAEQQIRAIRDHLLTFRGGPSPRRPATPGSQVAAN